MNRVSVIISFLKVFFFKKRGRERGREREGERERDRK